MRLFDITQYEYPEAQSINLAQTKHNVGIFLLAYKRSRERIGLPQISMEYSLDKKEYSFLFNKLETIGLDEQQEEFTDLNKMFNLGYSSIMHPFRPEVTARRRKVFMLRYLQGLPIPLVSERINYQRNIIIDDSKKSIIQFAEPLSLLVHEKTTVSKQLKEIQPT